LQGRRSADLFNVTQGRRCGCPLEFCFCQWPRRLVCVLCPCVQYVCCVVCHCFVCEGSRYNRFVSGTLLFLEHGTHGRSACAQLHWFLFLTFRVRGQGYAWPGFISTSLVNVVVVRSDVVGEPRRVQ
jgi:hypothetical protein